MTQKELYNLLKLTNYPVAHISFNSPQKPPYIVYMIVGEQQRGSDFKNHISDKSYRIELYTEYVDAQAELKLDKLFNFTEFSKDIIKIDDEKMMMTVYEFNSIDKF